MSQAPSQVPVQAPQGQVSVQEQERQQRQREVERQKQARTEQAKHIQLAPEKESFRPFLTSEGSKASQAKAKSRDFYAKIGFPQFGGKYAPFSIPTGKKVGTIRETPRGLKAIFTPSKWQEPSETFRPEPQLPSQELVRVQYPELKGDEPERFMSENVRAWTQAGFPQYGSVYKFPFGTGVPEGWRTKSVVLAPYGKGNELIWTIEQFATYTLTPEAEAQEKASQKFYAEIGYPQFGGAYAPFDIPSGFKVTGVKETFDWGEGGPHPGALESKLAVSFESIGVPTSPTEIMSTPKPSTSYIGRWSELKDFGQDIANVKANAGTSSLTAIVEQYAETRYSKDVVTRTMQKTGFLPSQASSLMKVAGAVSTVESYINPNVPSLFELGSKSPEFIIGRLTGEVMLMAFGGEVFSWMAEGTPSPIRFRGSRPESWLIEHSDWYAKRAAKNISYGLIDIPDVNVVKPVSLAGLEAEATATTLAVAPHTGMLDPLLLIPQEIPITGRLFALPSLPYLPEFSALKGSSFLPRLIGASAMFGLGFASLSKTSQQPKQVERLKAFQESFAVPTLKSLSLTESRTRQRQVPALLLGLSLAQETKQVSALASISSLALESKQMQRQVQKLRQEFKIPTLQRQITPFKFPSEEPFIRKHKKRGRKGFMLELGIGEFFYPEPPQNLFGKPSKRRHKK